MSQCVVSIFLTLVVLFLPMKNWASPHEDAPTKLSEVDSGESDIDPQRAENMAISEVPKINKFSERLVQKFNKSDYFYTYRKELDIHGGVVFGIKDSSDDEDLMNVILGFGYMLYKDLSPKWVLGADLSMVGHGHFWAEKRSIYNEKGSFRPFYQYGLMHKLVPEEKFASLSNWDNFLFRFGVGFADILKPPKSVQLELNAAVGAKDFLIVFTYGYSWGF